MTIEEKLGDLCVAYRQEVEKGTFLFTPIELTIKFLAHLKKSFADKEIKRDDVFAMVQKLRTALSEYDQALQLRGSGDPEKQSLSEKQHKKLTFSLMAHQIKEIVALLDQDGGSSPSSQKSPSKRKPKMRSALRKQGWMRT